MRHLHTQVAILKRALRARGCAAEQAAGAGQGFENGLEGDGEGSLTRARLRLLRRLQGIANKAGLRVDADILDHVGPATVTRWLRLQRDGGPKTERALVHEMVLALGQHLRITDLGQLLATKPAKADSPSGGGSPPQPKPPASPPPRPPLPSRSALRPPGPARPPSGFPTMARPWPAPAPHRPSAPAAPPSKAEVDERATILARAQSAMDRAVAARLNAALERRLAQKATAEPGAGA